VDVFLGGASTQRRAIAAAWRSAARPHWAEAHADAVKVRTQLDELDALGGSADPAQQRARALAAARLDRPDAAELLLNAAEASPGDAELALRAGELLAKRDDMRGIPLLERAMQADPLATIGAAPAARAFFLRRAEPDRATAYETRLSLLYAEIKRAGEERQTFTGAEAVEPHGLAGGELDAVRRALDLPDLEAAYLARRKLAHLATSPHFVLAVLRRKTKQGSSDDTIAGVISSDLEKNFAYGVTVIVASRASHPAIAALREIEGTAVAL
jgi:hypothetical protein